MTFAQNVKSEICRNKLFLSRHQEAVAYGLLFYSKHFSKEDISIATEHSGVARLYLKTLQSKVKIETSLTLKEYRKSGDKYMYTVAVDSASDREKILNRFNRIGSDGTPQIFRDKHSRYAFLSGVFLVCGHIVDPNKEYHLEFSVNNRELVPPLLEIMDFATPKVFDRRKSSVVYIKDSGHIEEILTAIGATNSALEMMDVKIIKDVRNNVNRATNCETANLEKTVFASVSQIEDIKYILENGDVKLTDELLEIATLRIQNPEMSLRELGESLSSPLSRSGVNHRLKKLSMIAKSLKFEI